MTNPNPNRRKNIKPGLNVPAGLSPELEKYLQSVKEHLQGADGTRGQPKERFVTLDDLERIGLIKAGVKNGRGEITERLASTSTEVDSAVSDGRVDTLAELDDVDVSAVQDLDVLRYDAAEGMWFPSDQVALLDRDGQYWTGQNIYNDTDADQIIVGKRVEMDQGYVTLSRASGANAPGYVGFYDSTNTRKGYVGFQASSAYITLTSEDAWGVKIDSTEDLLLEADTYTRLIQATGVQISSSVNLPTTLVMNGTVPYINIGGSGANESFMMLQRYNNASGGPDIAMYHSRSASVGTHTILQSGDEIGSISFYASDGTSTPVKVARIIGFINNAVSGDGDLGSRISILTTPDGSETSQVTAFFSPAEVELNATDFDFNGNLDVSGTSLLTGNVRMTGATALELESTLPLLMFDETDAAADERQWHMRTSGGAFRLDTYSDAGVIGNNAIFIDRSGTTVSEVEINGTVLDFNGTAEFSGSVGVGTTPARALHIVNTAAWIRLEESDAGTNEKVWLIGQSGGGPAAGLQILTRTDADGTGAQAMQILRTGTVVDEIQFDATFLDFNGAADISGNLNIGGTLSTVAINSTGALTVTNTVPAIRLVETGVTANNTTWGWAANGEIFQGLVYSDDLSSSATYMFVNRTANVIDQVRFDATEIEINGTLDQNGAADFSTTVTIHGSGLGSGLNIAASSAFITYDDTDAATDESLWGWGVNSNQFRLTTMADASPTAIVVTPIIVQRSGTAITEIELNATTLDFNGNIDFDGTTYDIDAATSLTLHGGSADFLLSGTSATITASTVSVTGTLRVGTAGDTSNPLQLFGNDATGDNYIGFYEDDLSTRKAYLGFGNVGDDTFYIAVEEAAGNITMQTNALTRLTINANGTSTWTNSASMTVPSGWSLITGGGTLTFTGTGETLATFADDGAVTLYYDNTARIATTSVGAAVTGELTVSSVATFSAAPIITHSAPQLYFVETGVTANNTRWSWTVDGEQFTGRLWNDANNSQQPWITVERTANVCDEIQLDATTIDINGAADISGSLAWGGGAAIASSDDVGSVEYEESAANSSTGTGWAAMPTLQLSLTRIGRVVYWALGPGVVTGTSNASTILFTGAVPADFRPSAGQTGGCPLPFTNNGVGAGGDSAYVGIWFATNGDVAFYRNSTGQTDSSGGGWTSSGTKAIHACTGFYLL